MQQDSISVPLSSKKHPGLVAWIDAEDAPKVAGRTWFVQATRHTFYAYAWHIKGGQRRRVHMHELIAGYPKPDHKDGNGLNNRRGNLRPATPAQQCWNARPKSGSRSGYKGVGRRRDVDGWSAQIGGMPHRVHLGIYATPEEAAKIYDAAAILLYGEYARINGDSIDPQALLIVVGIFARKGVALPCSWSRP